MRAEDKMISHMSTTKRIIALIVLCTVYFSAMCACSSTEQKSSSEPDIQDGYSVVISAGRTDATKVDEKDMVSTTNIITDRVKALAGSEATVQRLGSNRILVRTPKALSETVCSALVARGKLEFVDLRDITDVEVVSEIESQRMGMTLEQGTYTAFMTGDDIVRTDVVPESGASNYYHISFEIGPTGKFVFSDVTSELAPSNGTIVILLDGVVKKTFSVTEVIRDGHVDLNDRYTYGQAEALKMVLDSKSLPEGLMLSLSSSDN